MTKKKNTTYEAFFTCDCGTEALKMDYDTAFGEYFLYLSIFGYYGSVSGFRVLKEKVKNIFKVFFGKDEGSKTVVCISKSRAKAMLQFLKDATGIKPRKLKDVGLFGGYFHDAEGFNLLLVEPDVECDCLNFWMCPNYIFWGKKTKWCKAWRILKDGTWSIGSMTMDPDNDEVKFFMDYLYTVLKLDWEGYKNEKTDKKAK